MEGRKLLVAIFCNHWIALDTLNNRYSKSFTGGDWKRIGRLDPEITDQTWSRGMSIDASHLGTVIFNEPSSRMVQIIHITLLPVYIRGRGIDWALLYLPSVWLSCMD
jgi:hypothetical protein